MGKISFGWFFILIFLQSVVNAECIIRSTYDLHVEKSLCDDVDARLTGILRQKDVEQALILEEKMALQLRLLAAAGVSNVPEPPTYCHLVTEESDTNRMCKEVLSAVQVTSALSVFAN